MLSKTAGIVLHTTKYNDKMSLIHILTKEFGVVTYAVNPGTGKRSNRKKAFFQPFSILEMDVDHKANRSIQKIKDCKIAFPLLSVQFDPLKVPISFFLSEFIFRSVKESAPNKPLFDFVLQSIHILDYATKGIANFHLFFLLKLTLFLGFYPNIETTGGDDYFDMLNGIFVKQKPLHNHYLTYHDARLFRLLMQMTYENMHLFKFSRNDRMKVIEKIIEYYKLHLTEFSSPKSLDVLHDLFN